MLSITITAGSNKLQRFFVPPFRRDYTGHYYIVLGPSELSVLTPLTYGHTTKWSARILPGGIKRLERRLLSAHG